MYIRSPPICQNITFTYYYFSQDLFVHLLFSSKFFFISNNIYVNDKRKMYILLNLMAEAFLGFSYQVVRD